MAHIRLERTIWPVGHGAFCTEQFKDENNHVLFTAVYDCGSEQEKALEKCIKEFLPEKEQLIIDALFISHFHDDHVNKLNYLLQKNVSVRNLFIPQLTDDYVLSILATNTTNGRRGTANNSLLEQLYKRQKVDHIETIYEVPQINSDYVPEGEYRGIDNAKYKYQAAQFTFADPRIPFWVYVPCNIFVPSDSLKQEFIKSGYGDQANNEVDVDLVFDALKNGLWKDIQDIYKKAFPKGHNEYSMTVYSGFAQNVRLHCEESDINYHVSAYHQNSCSLYYPYCIEDLLYRDAGCLYTGDFEAKNHGQKLIQFYTQNFNLWDKVQMMQIPHHGSFKDNYYKGLYDYRKLTFASTAANDKYGHPHVQTLANISTMGCPIVVVQDNKATTLITMYEITTI